MEHMFYSPVFFAGEELPKGLISGLDDWRPLRIMENTVACGDSTRDLALLQAKTGELRDHRLLKKKQGNYTHSQGKLHDPKKIS